MIPWMLSLVGLKLAAIRFIEKCTNRLQLLSLPSKTWLFQDEDITWQTKTFPLEAQNDRVTQPPLLHRHLSQSICEMIAFINGPIQHY